jgi:hypothetical protein
MALKNLSDKISSKLSLEKEKIQEEFDKKIELFSRELENNDFKIFLKNKEIDFSQKKEEYSNLNLNKINNEVKNSYFSKKRKLYNLFKEKITTKIHNLEDLELETLFEKYLKFSNSELSLKKIQVDKKLYPILKKYISSSINVEKKENTKGFIFSNKTGDKVINCSYNNIIKDLIESNNKIIDMEFNKI